MESHGDRVLKMPCRELHSLPPGILRLACRVTDAVKRVIHEETAESAAAWRKEKLKNMRGENVAKVELVASFAEHQSISSIITTKYYRHYLWLYAKAVVARRDTAHLVKIVLVQRYRRVCRRNTQAHEKWEHQAMNGDVHR